MVIKLKNNLREFIVISTQAERDAGIFPFINAKGNFFLLRAVYYGASAVPNQTFTTDIPVQFEFDEDQGKITRRAGEGGSRDYDRIKLVPLPPSSPVETGTIKMIVIAGFGDLYSEREDEVVPQYMDTHEVTVPANDEVVFFHPGARFVKEIRLHIKLTEPDGLYYFGQTPVSGDGAWLEKGVTEWISYSGQLNFKNTTASDINVNVAVLARNDF